MTCEEAFEKYLDTKMPDNITTMQEAAKFIFNAGYKAGMERCIDIIELRDTERDAEAYLCGYIHADSAIHFIRKEIEK